MHTLKQQLSKTLSALLFVCVVFSNNVFAEMPAAEHNAHHPQNNISWSGVYQGLTPCADCSGIQTELVLNKNNTYMLMTQFIGKSTRQFVEKGKFAWGEGNSVILTSRDGKTTRHYLIGDNTLTQLNEQGGRISGSDADKYVLRRNDVAGGPKEHRMH